MKASYSADEQTIAAAMERFCKAEEEYKKVFGRNSLDRVILHDPTWLNEDNFDKATKLLKRAIRQNKPFEPIPEEMYKQMVF